MSKVDACVRGTEEKRGEEQGLRGRDCAPSRTAGGLGQMWRGVEVRECMQLACLTCRCGEVGEVERYKASGCWSAVIRASGRGMGVVVVRWSLGGPVWVCWCSAVKQVYGRANRTKQRVKSER
jgi:hypothetical protein